MLWLSTPLHKIFFFPRQVLCIALLVAGMQLPMLAQDSIPSTFRRFDVFPAISYSPETKLTLGVIGYAYFDWRGGDLATPLSFVEFLAVYTTANQILFSLVLFTVVYTVLLILFLYLMTKKIQHGPDHSLNDEDANSRRDNPLMDQI
jgi:hypothetical protein